MFTVGMLCHENSINQVKEACSTQGVISQWFIAPSVGSVYKAQYRLYSACLHKLSFILEIIAIVAL